MHFARLQRPLQRAAASGFRPFGAVLRTTTSLEDRFAHLRIASPTAANATVQGKRYASVKSQGAYKTKPKKTIPKKLGAKKTGGTFSAARRQSRALSSIPQAGAHVNTGGGANNESTC
jgi:protein phosphatase inhibitor 2